MTRDVTYANSACPYCSAKLDPLPKAKKKCPECGEPIFVRSGPDGMTYLLQEADLPVLAAAWQERDEAEARESIENANRLGRDSYERTIRECREFGIANVEYIVADDACAACKALVGRVLDLVAAPPLPIAGCRSEFCRCAVVGNFD